MRKPYVILIGSASGIGKSTIAAELAKSLNIKHLIESDFIRAVVRGIIGKEYAPALHSSSYDAYKSIRNKINRQNNFETSNIVKTANAAYMQTEAINKLKSLGYNPKLMEVNVSNGRILDRGILMISENPIAIMTAQKR